MSRMPIRKPTWPLVVLPFVLAVAVIGEVVWHYAYRQELSQLERRGTADMSLVLGGLISDLQRHRDQAVALAEHPTLTALSTPTRVNPARQEAARQLLVAAADRTGAAALFYVNISGDVLAASQADPPEQLAQSDYFSRAMDGALGSAHAVEGGTGRRVFQFAAPSFGPDGKVQGALIALADAENVEFGWRGSQTAVFLVDDAGRVFMSNRSELLGWRGIPGERLLVPPDGAPVGFLRQSVGPHEIWQVNLGPYLPRRALQLAQALPRIGMTGVALVDVAPARQIAALQAGAVASVLLFFGALLFLTQERRRDLARANAQLEGRVAERTATLTQTNLALRREVRERQEAQAALKRAQA
ncbi:MAG: sensor histidine kinase, partial [Roseovarius sp.]|nr:sensor histidine kinase [Roseovarius sp.]